MKINWERLDSGLMQCVAAEDFGKVTKGDRGIILSASRINLVEDSFLGRNVIFDNSIVCNSVVLHGKLFNSKVEHTQANTLEAFNSSVEKLEAVTAIVTDAKIVRVKAYHLTVLQSNVTDAALTDAHIKFSQVHTLQAANCRVDNVNIVRTKCVSLNAKIGTIHDATVELIAAERAFVSKVTARSLELYDSNVRNVDIPTLAAVFYNSELQGKLLNGVYRNIRCKTLVEVTHPNHWVSVQNLLGYDVSVVLTRDGAVVNVSMQGATQFEGLLGKFSEWAVGSQNRALRDAVLGVVP